MKAVTDRDFFLVKNFATKKIVESFGDLEKELKKMVGNYAIEVEGLNASGGKIFRGENYRLYPYVILDCPRLFSTRSIFAFRTMFWWGHEFSFTFHIQGEALESFRASLTERVNMLSGRDFFFCINNTPWEYDFSGENYLPLESITNLKRETQTRPFLKLSRKLEINSCENLYEYCIETYDLILKMLKNR